MQDSITKPKKLVNQEQSSRLLASMPPLPNTASQKLPQSGFPGTALARTAYKLDRSLTCLPSFAVPVFFPVSPKEREDSRAERGEGEGEEEEEP